MFLSLNSYLLCSQIPIILTVSKINITYPKKSLTNIAWDNTMSSVQWIPEGDQSQNSDSQETEMLTV